MINHTTSSEIVIDEERLKQDLVIFTGLRYQKGFFDFLKALPKYITKAELEIFLIIVKSEGKFYSQTDIFNHINESYAPINKVEKENKTEDEIRKYADKKSLTYISTMDKKAFFSKEGILTNLMQAELIKEKPSKESNKRTHKYKEIALNKPEWVFRYDNKEYSSQKEDLIVKNEWTKADLINMLETYLYDIRPRVKSLSKVNQIIKDLTPEKREEYLYVALQHEKNALGFEISNYSSYLDEYSLKPLKLPKIDKKEEERLEKEFEELNKTKI